MGFPRQEYWSGLPFPSPEELLNSGIEPMFPSLADRFFTIELPGKPCWNQCLNTKKKKKRKEKFCKSVFKFNGKEFIRLEIKCNLDDADMNRNMNPIFLSLYLRRIQDNLKPSFVKVFWEIEYILKPLSIYSMLNLVYNLTWILYKKQWKSYICNTHTNTHTHNGVCGIFPWCWFLRLS